MNKAALVSGEDPDQLSFLHAVHAVRRKIATFGAISPSGPEEVHKAVLKEILDEPAASSRIRRNQRGVERKMSSYPLRRGYEHSPLIDLGAAIRVVK